MLPRILLRFALVLFCSVTVSRAATQDSTASDALNRAASALGASALFPGVVIKGTVTYTAGSTTDSGHIQMEAAGVFDANVQMHLSGGDIISVSHLDGGVVTANGNKQLVPLHNALVIAAWFSPAQIVSAWLTDPTFLVASAGIEQQNGTSLLRLHCVRGFQQNDRDTQLLQQATAMDLFIDTSTWLPVELDFNTHPNEDALKNIPVQILFSGYGPAAGAVAPFHVQKYLQGTLLLDIVAGSITSATISDSDFSLQ